VSGRLSPANRPTGQCSQKLQDRNDGEDCAVRAPSLSLSRKEDLSSLPLAARQMERHEFSSQSFVPIEVGRWLVVVAPHAREHVA
jgi:ureidoglycolate hydrolase